MKFTDIKDLESVEVFSEKKTFELAKIVFMKLNMHTGLKENYPKVFSNSNLRFSLKDIPDVAVNPRSCFAAMQL